MSDAFHRINAALHERYQVERKLGEGGMATVYLARDLRHERHVAVKVLKAELAALVGPERFIAEIRTTAALQHPHILPLFDSGEADGFLFYVMPYVEGESLRQRLDRERQLPVDEAVRITMRVAEALDHAHRRGVIHRDVKPANILLHDGEPLLADFGIALAVGLAGDRLTETGLSVGTPHYMSPEQATGDERVGPATDVYALGCVLYEMLAGEPPFTGRTPQAILGKIIQGQPVPLTEHRPSVPLHVQEAVQRALERVPADRFSSPAAFAAALRDPSFRHRSAVPAVGSRATPGWGRWAGWMVAGAFALALAVQSTMGPPAPFLARQLLSTADLAPIEAPFGLLAAIAPDGSSMVLPVGSWPGHQLGLKARGSTEVIPITGTDGARSVAFAPDGRSIVYTSDNQLVLRNLASGSVVTLAEDTDEVAAALTWLSDGTLLYEQMSGGSGAFIARIIRIPAEGGAPLHVFEWSEAGAGFPIWMHALPGARGALVVACEGIATCTAEAASLYVLDLESESIELIAEQVIRAWYEPRTAHVIVVRPNGAVFAIPFDLPAQRPEGGPVPLFEGVRVGASHADMILGDDGTVLHVAGQATAYGLASLVWVDRSGQEEPLDPELGPRGFTSLSLAPDDSRIAVSIESVQSSEIWVKDVPEGSLVPFTEHAGATRWPSWSVDGRDIFYINNAGGTPHVRRIRSDGSSGTRFDVVLRTELPVMEAVAAPDGRTLFYREGQPPFSPSRLGRFDLGSQTSAIEYEGVDESGLDLSPDGRWLAYVSGVSGRREVFVRSTDGSGVRTQVSTGGGIDPLWAHNGRELFYRREDGPVVAVTYSTDAGFRVTSRSELFSAQPYFMGVQYHSAYDVTRDDERFVMLRRVEGDARLVLTEGWLQELRERLDR